MSTRIWHLSRAISNSGKKKLNFCKHFRIPGSNFACTCTPFVVSFPFVFHLQDCLKSYVRGDERIQHQWSKACSSLPVHVHIKSTFLFIDDRFRRHTCSERKIHIRKFHFCSRVIPRFGRGGKFSPDLEQS